MRITRTIILLHIGLLAIFPGVRAQSPGAYCPCQEMPALMQNYKADYASLTRFYAPAQPSFREGAAGGNFRMGPAGSSPETRARMEQLYNSYLQQLGKIDFNGLSQECKADYILFKRDLNEKLRLSALEAQEFAAVKGYFPFADTIYALQRQRRRGVRPDAQKVAANWERMTDQINDLLPRLRQDTSLTVTSI
ncbi:MAG TPA: hypothetical protein VI233_05235, partial [Puia sp.]